MCKCGEVIRDQKDNLPYKGYLFADTGYSEMFERISADVASFIEARLAGREREWIARYFNKGYPRGKDDDIVFDIMTGHMVPVERDVYQCPKCGRIFVERREEPSRLDSFAPDETPHKDVFAK